MKVRELHSTRFIPKYNTHVFPKHIDVEIEQPKHLALEVLRKNPMIIEQALVTAKLPQIIANIDQEGQTVIYTEYAQAVRGEGYSYGFLIGEDHTGLKLFKQGKIQVLIASHTASVGVDGLQDVCNRLII